MKKIKEFSIAVNQNARFLSYADNPLALKGYKKYKTSATESIENSSNNKIKIKNV